MTRSRRRDTIRATCAAVLSAGLVLIAEAAAPGIMQSGENRASVSRADVVVYGATPAGVTAAVAAALAIESNVSVQAVSYERVRRRSIEGGLRVAP